MTFFVGDQTKEYITSLSKKIYLKLISIKSKKINYKTNKIVFLLSFPSTSDYTLKYLYAEFGNRLVICYTRAGSNLAKNYHHKGCSTYNIDKVMTLITKVVPIVKSGSVVLCDNYFPFLAGIDFFDETKVVQLWHANGAIKKFGLEAEYAKKASKKDRNRYKKVYGKFTHYVVSSNRMASIFEKNYKQSINILPFGYPPTDAYFDEKWIIETKEKFRSLYTQGHKTLLYVPTYREEQSENPINLQKLHEELGDDWTIFAKAHPHDRMLQKKIDNIPEIISDFNQLTLRELLPSVDCLVTDYSSVIFEYSLANRNGNVIFFCYDLEEYTKKVGLEKSFEKLLNKTKVVQTTEQLFYEIKKNRSKNFSSFNSEWNEFVTGSSIIQLINWIK